MRTFKTVVMTLAALAVATQVAGAELPKASAANLRAAKTRLAWEAQKTKGAPSQLLRMEERKVDHLIDDLERGRSVDPREIDRLLEQTR